jgi:hypothetical protein
VVTQRQYETEAFESADKKYDLMGTLTDDDGNSIAEVDLAIKCEDDGTEYSATTDSDGKFLLENVGPGKYTVTVDSEDYVKTSEDHQVGDGSDEETSAGSDDSGSDDNDEAKTSDESETDESADQSSDESETKSSNDEEGSDSDS